MKNKNEIVKSVSGVVNKSVMKLKKHSPEILIVAGIAGTVVSAVIACKATTKVNKIVEDTKNDIEKVHTAVDTGVTEAGESYSVEDSKKDLTIIYAQESFVARYAGSRFPSKEAEQHYALCLRKNGTMIGDLCVFFTEKDNCFTLGITIAPMFQGQGYGQELLQAVIAKLQRHFPAVDIVALIEKENTRSIALFQKLGFVEECYAESVGSYIYVIYGKPDANP